MKTLEFKVTDKSKWGEGGWLTEPDKKQWMDEETGLPCLIVRSPVGALNGYVGVDNNHSLYKKDCHEVDELMPDLEVHGGLTFSGKSEKKLDKKLLIFHVVEPGENEDVWWLGFDCAHAGDFCPLIARYLNFPGFKNPYPIQDNYKDIEWVKKEVESLAKQIKEFKCE